MIKPTILNLEWIFWGIKMIKVKQLFGKQGVFVVGCLVHNIRILFCLVGSMNVNYVCLNLTLPSCFFFQIVVQCT